MTVEFIGHTPSVCENPADAAIWLDIAAESRLTLVKQRVRLANDLAAFPAPFVDTASNEPSVLPMVFTSAPTSMEKQAAAVLASIVGRMSDWRGADFPVFYNGTPAEGHFVVFATNERRPDFLHDLPKADGPMVTIADAPASLSGKMLVIQGRNDEDLLAAVRALGTDRPVMVGETFRVKKAEVPPVREAYEKLGVKAEVVPFINDMAAPIRGLRRGDLPRGRDERLRALRGGRGEHSRSVRRQDDGASDGQREVHGRASCRDHGAAARVYGRAHGRTHLGAHPRPSA